MTDKSATTPECEDDDRVFGYIVIALLIAVVLAFTACQPMTGCAPVLYGSSPPVCSTANQ